MESYGINKKSGRIQQLILHSSDWLWMLRPKVMAAVSFDVQQLAACLIMSSDIKSSLFRRAWIMSYKNNSPYIKSSDSSRIALHVSLTIQWHNYKLSLKQCTNCAKINNMKNNIYICQIIIWYNVCKIIICLSNNKSVKC